MKNIRIALLALVAVVSASADTVYYAGLEDTIGHSSDNDYNDLVISISGASLVQFGGLFTNLTTAVALSNSGTPFWNNQSFDGLHANFGDDLEGQGTYSGGPVGPGLEYLATASGGIDTDVFFVGGATTVKLNGITAASDSVGWCLVSHCVINAGDTLFGPGAANGSSASFTPSGAWELWGSNGSQTFYSDPGQSQVTSFAFAQSGTAGDPPAVPEPATFVIAGAGLVAIGLFRRK